MNTYDVTVKNAETGEVYGTVRVQRADEWKARTGAMAEGTFRFPGGVGIAYDVVQVEAEVA